MISRRSALAALSAYGAAATLPARAANLQKITIAVGAEHQLTYLTFDLAKALGYYEHEGLDVNIIYARAGSEAAQALVSGSADFSGNSIDHTYAGQKQGKILTMVYNLMAFPGLILLVRGEDKEKYKSVKDLKGKTVGVSSLGSGTHVSLMWMAKRAGLSKDDLKVVGVGTGTTMPASLNGKLVDAAMGSDPLATSMVRSGKAAMMVDLCRASGFRQAFGMSSYVFTGCLARAETIKEKPELVQKVVNALVRAHKFMATHSATAVANSMNEEFRSGLSVQDWTPGFEHARLSYSPLGQTSPDGVRNVVEVSAYFLGDPAGKVEPEKMYDNSFVEKARKSA